MHRAALAAILLATAGCATRTAQPPAAASAEPAGYDLAAQRAKIARIEMNPDTGFLSAEEREVVNYLIQAADLLDPVFLRQVSADNPRVREEIERSGRADRGLLLDWFDFNAGPWDTLADNRPFWGGRPLPPGGGVYPADLTREALDSYLAAPPRAEGRSDQPLYRGPPRRRPPRRRALQRRIQAVAGAGGEAPRESGGADEQRQPEALPHAPGEGVQDQRLLRIRDGLDGRFRDPDRGRDRAL
jgi:hypothetical protein